ncbi:MAG TPA: glycosyltransferase [Acidimicrobiales bacterium]|nr:glycosyltransferase [Acidimicrobiales bacterium]
MTTLAHFSDAAAPRSGEPSRRLTTSVVICAFSLPRWPVTRAAVESVLAQSRPADEVLLVIDYNDALFELAANELTGVRVVLNQHQKGLAGGKNTGLEIAQTDLVAFLDDDAVADRMWLERLVAHVEADDDVLGAGSAVHPAWAGAAPAWFPPEFLWVVGCSYRGLPEKTATVRNPFGGAMVVRRAVALEAGGFSTTLGRVGDKPTGCEETEFCIRVQRQAGGRFLFDPEASISHAVPADRGRWSYFLRRCYYEGRSKAIVARHAGSDMALESERPYVARILPTALLRSARRVLSGDLNGFNEGMAIVAGLLTTCLGYGQGVARRYVHADET